MILQGNQRDGAKDLALHLLKDENEHVEIQELRGFVAGDLMGALNEAYAISRGTKAKQFLYSLSLNPPPGEKVSTADFEKAIERVEKKLGLTGQPRAIVFHEKEGRRHAHAVWSRIDAAEMKAIPLPYTKRKLQEISRKLYLEHGWEMPRGFMNAQERDPKNFTHVQWQQAKRIGKDPREIMAALQDAWAISDSQAAFQQALKERGYILARGDRRGFVALDCKCNPFSISKKWIGVRAKDVQAKLDRPESLPCVDEAKAQIAKDMQTRLGQLRAQHNAVVQNRMAEIRAKVKAMTEKHRADREALRHVHLARWQAEVLARQRRFRRGLRGLMDRVTGTYTRIKEQNERETLRAHQRDRQEKDALIFKQLEQRRNLKARIRRLQEFTQERSQVLTQDRQQYKDIQAGKREKADFREKPPKSAMADFKQTMQKRRTTADFKDHIRSRNRTREGPELER